MVEGRFVGGIALVLLTSGCPADPGKGDSAGETDPCVPVADAGVDQSVVLGDSVALDASGSVDCDAEGESAAVYTWSLDTLPEGSALDDSVFGENANNAAQATGFTPDVLGTWVVTLVVSHDGQSSAEDITIVTVESGSQAPVADCGGDVEVLVGQLAELDGSGSSDPEGEELSYAWELSSVPTGSSVHGLFGADTAVASLVPDIAGYYSVGLVVSDGELSSETAYCTVTAVDPNYPPIADAGEGGEVICEDRSLQLDGYGSFDPEGEELSYRWDLLDKPEGSEAGVECLDSGEACYGALSDIFSPNPVFTWDVEGSYSFQLEVSDGEQWSAPDVVTYMVSDC